MSTEKPVPTSHHYAGGCSRQRSHFLLMEFVYKGEVLIEPEELYSFLKSAKQMKIPLPDETENFMETIEEVIKTKINK